MLEQLDKYVHEFRKLVEPVWHEETAYKISKVLKYGPYISQGQCVVTALLLRDYLEKDFPLLSIEVILGSVLSAESGSILITSHGWLEAEHEGKRYILDVTIDQHPAISHSVICMLSNQQSKLFYKKTEILFKEDLTTHPNLLRRYQMLKTNFERARK